MSEGPWQKDFNEVIERNQFVHCCDLMDLPSILHISFSHSFRCDRPICDASSEPSRYRSHCDLMQNAKVMMTKHFSLKITFELTLFRKAVCQLESRASANVICFDPYRGARVGEASNPGPVKKKAAVTIAVCNPHAILSHKKRFWD